MNQLIVLFSNNLLPILIIAAASFVLASVMHVDPRPLSRVVLYIFSPCLIFNLLTSSNLTAANILGMLGFGVLHLLLVGLLAWLVVYWLKFERKLAVAVILVAMIPNAGNYGMSLSNFAFGEQALAFASIYFIASQILLNTAGVFVVSLGHFDIRQSIITLLKMPALYGVIAALVFNAFSWTVPIPVARAVELSGAAAIPAMLVLLGLQLQRANFSKNYLPLAAAVGLRMVASVSLGLPLASWFHLEGAAYQAGILEAAMPTAVMTTILSTEFEVEPAFVTQVVFITTLVSPLTLTPLMAWLGA